MESEDASFQMGGILWYVSDPRVPLKGRFTANQYNVSQHFSSVMTCFHPNGIDLFHENKRHIMFYSLHIRWNSTQLNTWISVQEILD